MWRDICLENRDAILEMVVQYREQLQKVERLIEHGESDQLYELFERCKRVRDERFG